MRLAVTLGMVAGTVAIAVPARASEPGRGSRVWVEAGGGLYNATLTTPAGRTSIDGGSARLRAGLGLEAAPRLFLGPAVGLEAAFVDSSREVCCGNFHRVDTARFGLEGAYYFDPRVGFSVRAGLGYGFAGLRHEGETGTLRSGTPRGIAFTAALARDWALGPRTSLGAVLRLESDVLTGNNYTLRTLTPSLSLVVVTHLAG